MPNMMPQKIFEILCGDEAQRSMYMRPCVSRKRVKDQRLAAGAILSMALLIVLVIDFVHGRLTSDDKGFS